MLREKRHYKIILNSWNLNLVHQFRAQERYGFLSEERNAGKRFMGEGVCGGLGKGSTKTRLFVKNSARTPNPRVEKFGVTPKPHKICSRRPAFARLRPARTNIWGLGITPIFLTRGLGYPLFF